MGDRDSNGNSCITMFKQWQWKQHCHCKRLGIIFMFLSSTSVNYYQSNDLDIPISYADTCHHYAEDMLSVCCMYGISGNVEYGRLHIDFSIFRCKQTLEYLNHSIRIFFSFSFSIRFCLLNHLGLLSNIIIQAFKICSFHRFDISICTLSNKCMNRVVFITGKTKNDSWGQPKQKKHVWNKKMNSWFNM